MRNLLVGFRWRDALDVFWLLDTFGEFWAVVLVNPIVVVVKGPRSTIGTRDRIQTTPVDVAERGPALETEGLRR